MIDIVSKLLSDKGPQLISSLQEQGFSLDQAEKFLPEAGKQVFDLVTSGNIDTDSILGKIDIASLANVVGADNNLISNGLQSILPSLVEYLGAGGIGGMLGSFKKLF